VAVFVNGFSFYTLTRTLPFFVMRKGQPDGIIPIEKRREQKEASLDYCTS
jgi:hypothetical protein